MLIEDFPPTLAEFDERFGSEEAYLARLRWPEGFFRLVQQGAHTGPVGYRELVGQPVRPSHKR